MEESSASCLVEKHRREKKELQAQIQALKKTVKGDKNKKKEVSIEILRLEDELENRHKGELENITAQVNDVSLVEELELVNEIPKLKVSKAQKRRDKKSQQEKERDLQIKVQETENLFGPRNIEIEAISNKLKEKQLKVFSIPSDGDCLYNAVLHQMTIKKYKPSSVDELRKKVADYMRMNKDDFILFMSNPETCEMYTANEFEDYCDKIGTTKMWGGQMEIRALSNSLKCPIQVVQATGPSSINQGEEFSGPPLVITYHRHMYKLGEHYNSTQIFVEESDE